VTQYKTSIDEVPLVEGLTSKEGWVNMQVQFLIDAEKGGADTFVIGRTVFPPGSKHNWHRHHSAEEWLYVESGEGLALMDGKEVPVGPGGLVFIPKNEWHGFRNPSDTDEVVALWGWGGAGSKETAGYEAQPAD
jgi:quercetin dioxygenase-like cupin family protein